MNDQNQPPPFISITTTPNGHGYHKPTTRYVQRRRPPRTGLAVFLGLAWFTVCLVPGLCFWPALLGCLLAPFITIGILLLPRE